MEKTNREIRALLSSMAPARAAQAVRLVGLPPDEETAVLAMDERGYSGRYLDDDLRGYSRGNSYARRHYVRGHYSRTDATEHLRDQINDMMRETDDDRIKDALRRAMDMMED